MGRPFKIQLLNFHRPLQLLRLGARLTLRTASIACPRSACTVRSSCVAFEGVLGHVPVWRPAWPSVNHRAWTQNGPQTCMWCNQVGLRAPCGSEPRRGVSLLGAESRGVGSGRLGTQPNGAFGHPDQVQPQARIDLGFRSTPIESPRGSNLDSIGSPGGLRLGFEWGARLARKLWPRRGARLRL
jgi:hypothetical protein